MSKYTKRLHGSRLSLRESPVMPAMCRTCPFADDGVPEVRASVSVRLLKGVVQICHHPRIVGKPETHLCKGALDWQALMFYRMGWLEEPTREALIARAEEATQ